MNKLSLQKERNYLAGLSEVGRKVAQGSSEDTINTGMAILKKKVDNMYRIYDEMWDGEVSNPKRISVMRDFISSLNRVGANMQKAISKIK